MDFTPVPHLLRSLANQNMNWVTALAELIDNSFDANATRVAVSVGDRKLVVEDDGVGIKDISCIGKLGAHSHHATTALGVYGVGLKDAWMYAGPRAPIPRNSGTRRRRATVVQEGDGSVEVNASTTRRRGFKIDWGHDDADKVGEFDALANIVRLNVDNRFVTASKESQNLPALYATAIAILADYCCNHDRNNEKLLIPLGDFSLTFGSILNSLQTKEVTNGQKAIS